MKRLYFILFFIVCLSFSSFSNDLSNVIDRGILRVGICSIETPPFFYKDKSGVWQGIDIELANDISNALGVQLELVFSPSFDEVVNNTALGNTDIAISNLSITMDRAKKVLYTQPYFKLKMKAFLNQLILDKIKFKSGDYNIDQKWVKIGVLKGSSYEGFANRSFPNADIKKFNTWDEVLKEMYNGNIDVSFYDEVAISRTIRKNPSISINFKNISFDEKIDPIAIAVNPKNIFLFQWIKKYLDINPVDHNLERHLDKYFSSLETEEKLPDKVFDDEYNMITNYSAAIIVIFGVIFFWKTKKIKIRSILYKVMLSPYTIIIAIILGVLYGLYVKKESAALFSIGDIYLTLLKMCSLPIMITAIITSLGKLFQSDNAGSYVKKLLIIIFVCLFASSTIGFFGGVFGKPGSALDKKAKEVLGNKVNISTVSSEDKNSMNNFIQRVIPSNIFSALSSGDVLGVLVFSILIGISIGFIDKENSREILNLMDTLFNSLIQIINWSMYILPLALFSLMAKQITNIGPEIMMAMGRFVIIYHILCIIMIAIVFILLSSKTKNSILEIFNKLKNALIIAFGTSNSYAAMPLAIESLNNNFECDSSKTKLVMPLGLTICRPGTIINLALGTVFISQLFNVPVFADSRWLIIIFGVVVSGIAGAGAPGPIEISMLSIIFPLLGLPMEVTMILLLSVNSITDPIRTVFNVITNTGITLFTSECKTNVDGQ